MIGAVPMRSLAAGIPPRRSEEYVKQPSPRGSQTGNPVYRVRTFSNSSTTDTEPSEPLNGKQPGVLNVEAPSAVSNPLLSATGHLCHHNPGVHAKEAQSMVQKFSEMLMM